MTYQEIYQAAVRLLAAREHSRQELLRKLSSRADMELLGQVLDRLAEERLQSDARFTEQYIQSRLHKGYGPLRIRQELRERGVDQAGIADWLDEHDSCWREALSAAYRRKFGEAKPCDFKALAKASRFLEYRGFASDQIRDFLRNGE